MRFLDNIQRRITQQTPLGTGGEKRVYVDPVKPEKVIKLYSHPTNIDANQLKGAEQRTKETTVRINFYLQKILHLLYPDHIPNRHLAATQPKLTVDERKTYERFAGFAPDSENKPNSVKELLILLEELDLKVDLADRNFGFDMEKKKAVYIDDIHMGDRTLQLLKEKIDHLTDLGQKSKASALFQRLNHLCEI